MDLAQVEDELWPNARRSPLNGQKVSLSWVDVNPLVFQLPVGYWIMAEDAPLQAVFSTVQADKARQESWLQVATSGDLDLVINNHIVTAATDLARNRKRLPHLPEVSTSDTKIGKAGETNGKVKGSPFLSAILQSYDISHWIRTGPERHRRDRQERT